MRVISLLTHYLLFLSHPLDPPLVPRMQTLRRRRQQERKKGSVGRRTGHGRGRGGRRTGGLRHPEEEAPEGLLSQQTGGGASLGPRCVLTRPSCAQP